MYVSGGLHGLRKNVSSDRDLLRPRGGVPARGNRVHRTIAQGSKRRIVNRTVEGAVPTRSAISRIGIPADFNLITSRMWHIANLSVGNPGLIPEIANVGIGGCTSPQPS